LHGHILEPINNELEGAVGKSSVGSLDVVVVWHELVENSLLGELINLGGVGNLSLVFEGLIVRKALADVQEVGDNASIAHPSVNGGLHELGLGLGNLTLLVSIIIAILDGGTAHIATLLGVPVIAALGVPVVATLGVITSVGVAAVAIGVAIGVAAVAVGVAIGVSIGVAIGVAIAVLWQSNSKRRKKESDGNGGELHFEGLFYRERD